MSLATTPNQFTQQLGYYQAVLDTEAEVDIGEVGEWVEFNPEFNLLDSYNTIMHRNNLQVSVGGIWKVDFSFSINGATNDDLGFRMVLATGSTLYPVMWNGRGGNNWAINYTQIFYSKGANTVSLELKNDTAEDNPTMKSAIWTAIKLY